MSCSENQQNIITVTFNIHQGKNKKAEVGQSSAFLCSSTSENSCASSSSANSNPMCIICSAHDAIDSFHAAGAWHTSKSKLNTENDWWC